MAEQRSNPRVTLVVVSVAGLAYAVMTSAIVPAIPTIQDDLHASENGVTFVLTGYLLAASVATAILGRLGDMLGKKSGIDSIRLAVERLGLDVPEEQWPDLLAKVKALGAEKRGLVTDEEFKALVYTER